MQFMTCKQASDLCRDKNCHIAQVEKSVKRMLQKSNTKLKASRTSSEVNKLVPCPLNFRSTLELLCYFYIILGVRSVLNQHYTMIGLFQW